LKKNNGGLERIVSFLYCNDDKLQSTSIAILTNLSREEKLADCISKLLELEKQTVEEFITNTELREKVKEKAPSYLKIAKQATQIGNIRLMDVYQALHLLYKKKGIISQNLDELLNEIKYISFPSLTQLCVQNVVLNRNKWTTIALKSVLPGDLYNAINVDLGL